MKKNYLLLSLMALGLYVSAQVPSCVADSSYQVARTFRIAKQYEAALEAYKIAAYEYEQAENWGCYFNCRKHQARILRDKFKQRKQVYADLKADLDFALQKLGRSHSETAELYVEVANTEQLFGLSELALQNRKQALEIRKAVFGVQSERVASSYLNIAITLRNDNRLREAYNYAEAGVLLLEKLEKKSYHFLGNGYHTLGLLARDLRRLEEAIVWFEKGLEARRIQQAPHPYIVLAIQNLGIAYDYLGDLDMAMDYFKHAQAYIQENITGKPLNVARNEFYIGKVYKRGAEFSKAIQKYQNVLPIYEATYSRNSRQVAIILNTIGESYFLMDSIVAAQSYYRAARRSLLPDQEDFPPLEEADEISSTSRLACQAIMENEAWSWLKWSEQQADPSAYLQQAVQLFDFSLRLSQLGIQSYRDRQDKELGSTHSHRLFEGAIEASYRLYEATGEITFLQQAMIYSERSKASLLREALKASAARNFAGIPDDVLYLEQQLHVQQAQWEQRIARERDTSQISLHKGSLFQIRLQKDSLQREIEKNYPSYFQLKYAQPTSDITAIQQKLKKGEWAVSFFAGDLQLYGFGLSNDHIIAFQRPFGEKFRDSLIQYYQQLSDGMRVEQGANQRSEKQLLADQSFYFFQQILSPLWKKMDQRPQSLLIVPDGIISHFPFESLLIHPLKDDQTYTSWPFLLKEVQIRYLPSIDGLLRDIKESKAQYSFAGFAPVYPQENLAIGASRSVLAHTKAFSPLSENQKEVSHIQQIMGGQTFLGKQASEKQFWEQASESSLLHLAMHSHLDTENPFFSALIFSPKTADSTDAQNDGLLYAYEFYQLKLNAELIVLSACESGYGKLLKGEGVMSLARSFRYAGGNNIVMSLWPVDDQSTADLMTQLYKYLDEGLPKDEALRKAKLNILGNSPFRHPYFWAGFILSGDDLPIQNGKNAYFWALLIIPAILAGIVLYRKYFRV